MQSRKAASQMRCSSIGMHYPVVMWHGSVHADVNHQTAAALLSHNESLEEGSRAQPRQPVATFPGKAARPQVRVRYQLGEDENLCGLRARLSPMTVREEWEHRRNAIFFSMAQPLVTGLIEIRASAF
jgi:hypothetical protein